MVGALLSLMHLAAMIGAMGLLVLCGFILAEVIAGVVLHKTVAITDGAPRGAVAIVVPAHNEASVIGATLDALTPQLGADDRLIVVADNCDDGTVDVARERGATVIERRDDTRRGKGFALQFAIDWLNAKPPDVVIFVDADCQCDAHLVERLSEVALATQKPAQALYLMARPVDDNPKAAVSAFAWAFINKTRMLGLNALAGVTRITGSGVAIPFPIASQLDLASGEIVEDLAVTIDLVRRGHPPQLVDDVVVTSELPSADSVVVTQRARWEIGSLRMARQNAFALLLEGIGRFDGRRIALGLDVAAPPLVLLAAACCAAWIAGVVFLILGFSAAFAAASLSLVILASAVVVGWIAHGREFLPASSIWRLGPYILSKAKIYGDGGRKSAQQWTKTDRDEP